MNGQPPASRRASTHSWYGRVRSRRFGPWGRAKSASLPSKALPRCSVPAASVATVVPAYVSAESIFKQRGWSYSRCVARSDYAVLKAEIRAAGLFERQTRYYALRALAGFVLLGGS